MSYLNSFEIIKRDLNDDEVEMTCKLIIVMPVGLNEDQTVSLNEILGDTVLLNMKLSDTEQRSARKMKRSVGNRARSNNNNLKRNQTRTNEPALYEIEIMEGPFKLLKTKHSNVLNLTCNLILVNHDHTYAFDTTIYKTIESVNKQAVLDESNRSSSLVLNFKLIVFMCQIFLIKF